MYGKPIKWQKPQQGICISTMREESQEIWEQQQKRTQVLTTVDILPRKRRNG
jgi:hypothetical protein